MILVTYKLKSGGTPPVLLHGANRKGRDIGVETVTIKDGPFVIPTEILRKMKTFRNVSLFLYVAPGAIVRPPLELLERKVYDVAAYVESISPRPVAPAPFSGIGKVHLGVLAFQQTEAARRVLERWEGRMEVSPLMDPSVALAISIFEIKEVKLFHLPPEYCWEESEHRTLNPMAQPVIERSHGLPAATVREIQKPPVKVEAPQKEGPRPPEVLWNGHLLSYASYGKINREILFRVANSVVVKIDPANSEVVLVDEYTRARVDAYKGTLIGLKAPFLRFFGPDFRPPSGRHRICWTMMETHGRVHADMARMVNDSYDQLWVPTAWNAETFKVGGVRIPINVVPLGVDPLIYRPQKRRKLPPCRLVSTSRRGFVGTPPGFVFLSVGLMSPRKGFDVLAEAADLAFTKKSDVDIVIATTHASSGWDLWIREIFSNKKTRVWILDGRFTEHEMALLYAGADAYASASIGEGWNLCAQEAAACGLPVIVPKNSAHPDVFGSDAFTFDPDGTARRRDVEKVSPWYVDMEFSSFGQKSKGDLAEIMKLIKAGGSDVRFRVDRLRNRATGMTWDVAAAQVVRRLIEVQPQEKS
jgi:glycosyltransferase involved in cell wall biosynthesis